jgi:hypothetical protein
LVFIACVFAGCTPQPERDYSIARGYFDSGQYHNAVSWAVAALKGRPDYEEAAGLLREAAPLAYQQHEERAASHEAQGNWGGAYEEYEALLSLNRQVRSLQKDFPTLDEAKLITALEDAANHAAEQHYVQAAAHLDRRAYKEAALEFRRVNTYVPHYKDSLDLYERARSLAMEQVAIMPFEYVGYHGEFSYLGSLVSDEVLENMVGKDLEFTEFVSELYLRGYLGDDYEGMYTQLPASSLWELGKRAGVDFFVYGRVFPVQVHALWPAGSLLGYKQYPPWVPGVARSSTATITPSEGEPYTVEAHWVERKLVNRVSVTVSYSIASTATQTVREAKTITFESSDEVQWADSFKGDERALPRAARDLLGRGVRYPRSPAILVEDCVDRAAGEITRALALAFSK